MGNVTVQGPDNKTYQFPEGTTKDTAVAFFKKKGIGAQPQQPSFNPTQTNPTQSFGSSGVEDKGLYPAIARGAANTFGIDHKAIDSAYSKEGTWGEWKELAGQVLHNQLPAIGKSLARIGAATGTGAAIGSVVPGAGTGFGAVVGGATQTVAEIDKAVEPALREALGKIRGSLSVTPGSVGATGIGTPSIRIGNRDQFAEGLTQFLGTAGLMASGSEKPHDIHGSVKLASEIAKKVGVDEAEATKFADKSSTGMLGRFVKHNSYLKQYIDAKGLQIKGKVKQAVAEVEKQVSAHAKNLDSQIDTNVPSGVIDAQAEATKIQQSLADVVKTPEKVHPRIQALLKDALDTSPGQWTFAKARQFRSSLGRALSSLEGPQKAVGSEVYADLTKKLSDTASKYKLEASWKQYNTLESQFHQNYGDIAHTIMDASHGEEVYNALKKSEGLRKRFTENLGKYGLNPDEVEKYVTSTGKYIKDVTGGTGTKSMWRLAHGSPAGAVATITGMTMGAGWMPSLAMGAFVGYTATELTNAIRAAKLPPEVLEKILEKTSLPGKMDLPKGVFPKGGDEPVTPRPTTPPVKQSPTPKPTPAKPKTLQGVSFSKEPPKAATVVTESTPSVKPNVEEAPKTEPKVTKVPEGQHGTGKIADQAKARERVDKLRKEKGSTAAGGGKLEVTGDDAAGKAMKAKEAAQALSKVNSHSIDVKTMQIPELEEALKNAPADLKEEFAGLRKMRATGDIDTGVYLEGLRYYYREFIEGKASSGTPEAE